MAQIYSLSNPLTSEVKYIGATEKSLAERLRGHLIGNTNVKNATWFRSLKRKGLVPKITLIETVVSSKKLSRERYWIKKMLSDGREINNIKWKRRKRNKVRFSVPLVFYDESAVLLKHMKKNRSVNLSDFFRKLFAENRKRTKKLYE